jgi:hypothetical protein
MVGCAHPDLKIGKREKGKGKTEKLILIRSGDEFVMTATFTFYLLPFGERSRLGRKNATYFKPGNPSRAVAPLLPFTFYLLPF